MRKIDWVLLTIIGLMMGIALAVAIV